MVPGHPRRGVRLVLVEGLLLDRGLREPVELLAVRDEGGDGLVVALVDDPPNLPVDKLPRRGPEAVETPAGFLTRRRPGREGPAASSPL